MPKFLRYPLLVIAQEHNIRSDTFKHFPRAHDRVARHNQDAWFDIYQHAHALLVTLARSMSFQFFNNLVRCNHDKELIAPRRGLAQEIFVALMQSVKNAKYHSGLFHTPPSYTMEPRAEAQRDSPIDAAGGFRYAGSMTVHIALFKWKPEITPGRIAKLLDDIRALKGQIPEIREIYAGENYSKWAKEYTHAVVVTCRSREDLNTYRAHPAHKPIADICDKYEADSIGFDFDA